RGPERKRVRGEAAVHLRIVRAGDELLAVAEQVERAVQRRVRGRLVARVGALRDAVVRTGERDWIDRAGNVAVLERAVLLAVGEIDLELPVVAQRLVDAREDFPRVDLVAAPGEAEAEVARQAEVRAALVARETARERHCVAVVHVEAYGECGTRRQVVL